MGADKAAADKAAAAKAAAPKRPANVGAVPDPFCNDADAACTLWAVSGLCSNPRYKAVLSSYCCNSCKGKGAASAQIREEFQPRGFESQLKEIREAYSKIAA